MAASPHRRRWPLKVLVDAYFIDRPYGFGRYVRELVYALDSAGVVELVVAVPAAGEAVARAHVRRARVVTAPDRFFPIWEQWVVPRLARRLGCDLVHFPYQSMALAWPRAQSVVTMHDLMFFRVDGSAASSIDRLAHAYRRWIYRLSTRRAGRVVAVSESTQGELIAQGLDDVAVIPNSCDAFAAAYPELDAVVSPGRYLLHRGSPGPHKNTRRIAAAFQMLRALHPKVELVVFGLDRSDPFAAEIEAPGVRFLGRVSDAQLAALYRGAAGVVVASTEEGFGLAIIEAFAFGAPVITSDRPPMSEIAVDAALLVDPDDTGAIARAMGILLDDERTVQRLRAAGERRRAEYSSAQVARRMEAVYRSLAA